MRNIYDIISEQRLMVEVNFASYDLKYTVEHFQQNDYLQEGVGESLKKAWETIKKWFINIINKIKSFFSKTKNVSSSVSSDDLNKIIKNNNELRGNTVSTYTTNPLKYAIESFKHLLSELMKLSLEENINKDEIFNNINGLKEKSKEGLTKLVRSFIIKEDIKEIKLIDINVDVMYEYCDSEKETIDIIKKEQNNMEKAFNNKMKEESNNNDDFRYIMNLCISISQTFISALVSVVKNGTQIINKINSYGEKEKDLNPEMAKFLKDGDNSIEGIRSKLITMIQNDQGFEKNYFNRGLKVLNIKDEELFEKHDNSRAMITDKKKSDFNTDDYVDAIFNLKQNFSKERLAEVKKISIALYSK